MKGDDKRLIFDGPTHIIGRLRTVFFGEVPTAPSFLLRGRVRILRFQDIRLDVEVTE